MAHSPHLDVRYFLQRYERRRQTTQRMLLCFNQTLTIHPAVPMHIRPYIIVAAPSHLMQDYSPQCSLPPQTLQPLPLPDPSTSRHQCA